MENKEEKNIGYSIAVTVLSFIVVIMLMIIIIGIRIIDDLNSTIDMYKNTIGVCNIDLKQVQKENNSMRKKLIELERKQ